MTTAGAQITDWISRTAVGLATASADGPSADLQELREIVGDAVVVGIGGSTYGAHEQFTLTTRVIKFLVQELGFRTVATEEDWDVALDINRYVLTGEGDLDELMRGSGVPWRTREVRAALAWIRAYNSEHPEPVRFVGVGVIDTKAPVYDLVTGYVERLAPAQLPTLREHFDVIRPVRPDHVRYFFTEVADRESFADHARACLELVNALPQVAGDRERELILQHTRQIVAFYEHYVFHVVEDGYRDQKMADNLRWWRDYTGDKIAYWSRSPHSVTCAEVTISIPPKGEIVFRPTGASLRDCYGRGYVSLGLTFDHGEINSGWALPPFTPRPMPAASQPAEFAERPLCEVPLEKYLVDLRAPAPAAVARWLAAPAKVRVIGSVCDPGQPAQAYWMTGGSMAEYFDAVLHTQVVTPTQPL
jgi:erythromycin esterase